MGKQLTKVIYKPDSQSTEEFIVIVNGPEVSNRAQSLDEMRYSIYFNST
jgi:hypothetical protein